VDAAAAEAAAALREGVLALADPDPALLFDHVYAGPHAQLDEERAAYESYLAGFDEPAEPVDPAESS
jgi:pyruvate dehydrogenase E1 component alpha subunit